MQNERKFPVSEERSNLSLDDLTNINTYNSAREVSNINYNIIRNLYNDRDNADYQLILKHGYSIKVHKFIVASNSSLSLDNLFSDSLSSSKPPLLGQVRSLSRGSDSSGKSLSSRSLSSPGSPAISSPSLSSLGSPIGISISFGYSGATTTKTKTSTQKLYINDCGPSSGELLVKLCYHQTVDWNLLENKTILETLRVAERFKMAYVKAEILSHLNRTAVTDKNFDDFKTFNGNEEGLNEFQKNWQYFLSDRKENDLETQKFEIIKGENPKTISNVKYGPIDNRKDCTYHEIGSGKEILLRLLEKSSINFIKMRLFDEKLRSYSYYIEVSKDNKNWIRIIDYSEYECRSWQFLHFSEKSVQYIKIVGTKCHDVIEWNYFEVSSIEIFKTNKPIKTIGHILCPNEDMAKLNKGAKLVRGVNKWILEDYRYGIVGKSTENFTYHKPYGDIVIQLSQVIYAKSIKLVTWGKVQYEFVISISTNNKKWDAIYEYDGEDVNKFEHVIDFELQKILFIKIFGQNVDENEDFDDSFRIVLFQCPASEY